MRGLLLRVLALCALLLTAHADAGAFLSCVRGSTAAFGRGSAEYANLTSLSFVNDRARPAAIVRARGVTDVVDAVRCARKSGLRVCARAGGHSLAGKSLCDGVVVDVGPMRAVRVRDDGSADVQAGATMGEMLWALHARGRWFGAGVCPGVGVAGYVLGGGHGPYTGRLGIACDSVREVTMVNGEGKVVTASNSRNRELFWGMCGAGGSQFGIVVSFRVQTADSRPFDRSVVFRFRWRQENAGEAMAKWVEYDENGGNVWFRMEQKTNKPSERSMNAYGACYDVSSVEECFVRLNKAEFFKVPGRSLVYAAKAKNALDAHAFFGPEGDWGHFRAPDLRKAMLEQRYVDAGIANNRIYQSAFMTFRGDDKPSAQFWQRYSEFCADPGLKSIPWVVCELGLFKNAVNRQTDNAFAHRSAHVLQHYIVGGGTEEERLMAYKWMQNHLTNYTSGVYLNYPELELGDTYPELYWGKHLGRLRALKSAQDPDIFFANPQPIPPYEKSE